MDLVMLGQAPDSGSSGLQLLVELINGCHNPSSSSGEMPGGASPPTAAAAAASTLGASTPPEGVAGAADGMRSLPSPPTAAGACKCARLIFLPSPQTDGVVPFWQQMEPLLEALERAPPSDASSEEDGEGEEGCDDEVGNWEWVDRQ